MQSVSVVMATFNSRRTVEQALRSVREQDYPQEKIEIVVADGGSRDGTRASAKKYGAKIVSERSGSPEAAKALALTKTRGELVLFLASDNELIGSGWLREMVKCLTGEKRAVAAYPWRYQWSAQDSSLNRYFALLGANDPVAWFMGRADRQTWGDESWRLCGAAEDKGKYFRVKFDEQKIPTLGDNGFLIWKEKLLKAKTEVNEFFHIDVCDDLIKQGYQDYVVVKNAIRHNTGGKFFEFLAKRRRYMRELYFRQKAKRRYRWGEGWEEKLRLVEYVIYALTMVGPIKWAVEGYRKKRDWAWFWHLPMCLGLVVVYGGEVVREEMRRRL